MPPHIEFEAQYYDGAISRAWPVKVRVSPEKVVEIEGLATPLRFELQQVTIAPRLGNTPRSLIFAAGAKCETLDNDAVDRVLAAHKRGRGLALVHVLESNWRTVLSFLALVVAVGVVGFFWGIPAVAERAAMRVTPQAAYSLGRGTLATLDEWMFSPSELSEERQNELRAKFELFAQDYPNLPLRLVFRDGSPNAFALPDGTVVVTDGLVALAKNDEEVLAVLAHEIGHVEHRHALRMTLESSFVGILALVYLGDASQVSAAAGALPTVLANSHYSRRHEEEADLFALETLRGHNIPPHHFADILSRLAEKLGDAPQGAMNYLSSHPPTADRIARFR